MQENSREVLDIMRSSWGCTGATTGMYQYVPLLDTRSYTSYKNQEEEEERITNLFPTKDHRASSSMYYVFPSKPGLLLVLD